MSSGGGEFEYPDTAGYPDGMGTLHEGVDDDHEQSDQSDEVATATEGDLERFALDDEEDVEGV